MRIRKATPADRDGIYRVHVTAVRVTCATHYAPFEIDGWVGTEPNEGYMPPFASCDIFVAIGDDSHGQEAHVIGFSQLNPSMYEIEAVYVDPDHGRCGIGAQLLRHAEDAARSRGLRELRLAASLNAVPFYQACGFIAHAEAKYQFRTGVSIRCVPMTKQLYE